MKKGEQLRPGKIKPLAKIIARMVQKDPTLADDEDRLYATLYLNIPQLKDKETCPNCEARMVEYIYEFDLHDAVLLLAMARSVRERMEKGMPFTEANKVRPHDRQDLSYTHKSRTTQCAKLGLITHTKNPAGKNILGTWTITARGWAALRGEPVPRYVRVWRGKITERYEELITITGALQSHARSIEAAKRKGKQPKNDHRHEFADYDPQEWYTIAGPHEGTLL